ncbi:MAG: type IX secretion system membrane protein PorP/SprF [Bacteroidia bacterium]|nr:MAG: type IX secretion system membrane protein PorP/SprF [Bacteroidia bacterium]
MIVLKRISILILILSPVCILSGQQSSLYPISTWLNNPIAYNPAITGSKDFFSIDLIAGSREDYRSQVISGNKRLLKTVPGYFSAPGYTEYSNFGAGGYIFNVKSELSHTIGIAATGSYQVKMDDSSLSYLSFGAAVRGIYNITDSISQADPEVSSPASKTFIPDLDAGIYYYGPSFYAGFSATNIIGNLPGKDSASLYKPESRRYNLIGGYKFVIIRNMDFVIEPSVIISATDTTFGDMSRNINPLLKIYFENFCIGSYFYDKDKISFFFQYNYPGIHLGAFFGLPRKSPYFKNEPTIEISVGVNLSYWKSKPHKSYHW